ncbi:hypothetical protein GUITHDRAFT_145872 [Guillardia theta CCMP2712]|uniref:Uncharacterized protein n=1 Tax=Guillardia theta (strain CCMP2712) TaxID=905079 RepID=L1IK75_GUITC|nr:hypothetical protein GUITHDRAFT_145872 [Guillardia theta CCMP2712]EKX36304.1 hypothetical protein GUITHDRAFT_145872 [Guillardia theta CCMP2712]|eukprot:XP_005823284.1 hypothetical protein GUITHDRAFT_145872 [Guillardia theta CCMP2712]
MKEKEEEKKRKEEEVREAVKRRQELWGMKDRVRREEQEQEQEQEALMLMLMWFIVQVLNALAKGEEERRRENQKREEEMKMERRDFKNKTKEHQERLKGFYQNANERSLLMHSVARRLKQEVTKKKQETKFRSVPVPHAMMDMELRRMQQQEEERNYRKKDRKEKILSQSSLPPRMQKYQEEFGNRGAGRRGGAEGITAEHTFRPAPPKIVPDFKSMQKAFEDELAEYKSRNLSSMKKSELKPFFLRSEWVKFEAFAKFRENMR